MLEPGQDRAKEERIIRAGYVMAYALRVVRNGTDCSESVAKTGLTEYMSSLRRLDRALAQMNDTNIRANQEAIGDCNELLDAGRRNLEDFFRSKLRESCKPIEPLHFITKGRHNAS